MSIHACAEPECRECAGSIAVRIGSRPKDLGSIEVRRVLPASAQRRVGPFVFFDQMGPAELAPGTGIDVRPHPHIGLSTLTYLFEGEIRHRDSLGFDQTITPGAANWMTAGRGIVHSERTPEALREARSKLHGLQVWLALPKAAEESPPSFEHHPAASLPRFEADGVRATIVAGTAWGLRSPIAVPSPTLFVVAELVAGAALELPDEHEERAVYVVSGEIAIEQERIGAGSMVVLQPGRTPTLQARSEARVALVGGAPLDGERHLFWNFVSSSRERIERAKQDWRAGRFAIVPGDDESIPLPDD